MQPYELIRSGRRTLALLTDAENRLYAVTMPGYGVRRVGTVEFDPRREAMSIVGTLLNWTVCVEGAAAEPEDQRLRYDGEGPCPWCGSTFPLRRPSPWNPVSGLIRRRVRWQTRESRLTR